MNSEALAYEEPLPAYGEPQPVHGEVLPLLAVVDDLDEQFDRGKDWPLAFAIFTPVLMAYAAISVAIYFAVQAIA
jgi:hypothetical protein